MSGAGVYPIGTLGFPKDSPDASEGLLGGIPAIYHEPKKCHYCKSTVATHAATCMTCGAPQ